jgi:uncharacterized protein
MIEDIGFPVIFGGLILCIYGLVLIIQNQNHFLTCFGISISKNNLLTSFLFFSMILFLFAAVVWLNINRDLISVGSLRDIQLLLKSIPIDFATAVFEEFVFRVLIFSSIYYLVKNKIGTVLLTAIIFSFFHFPEKLLYFLSYFLGGIMYGYAFVKFQSIWVPIAIHFSWNFIQGAVFGFPVSGMPSEGILSLEITPDVFFNGGDQGPEGSVLGIMMRFIIILMIVFLKSGPPNQQFLRFK